MWGVAQTVKKKTTNTLYGTFEQGDIVTGEKRFEAVVERYVWPGNDAISGQGHVNGSGSYDQLSSSAPNPGYPPPYSGGIRGRNWMAQMRPRILCLLRATPGFKTLQIILRAQWSQLIIPWARQ